MSYLWTPEDTQREAKLKPWETPPTPLLFICPECQGHSVLDSCSLCSGACCVTEKVAQEYRTRHGWGDAEEEAQANSAPLFAFFLACVFFVLSIEYAGAPRLACWVATGLLLGWAWWLGRGK